MVRVIFEWLDKELQVQMKIGEKLERIFSNGRMFGEILLSKKVLPRNVYDKLSHSEELEHREKNIFLLLPYLFHIGLDLRFVDVKDFISGHTNAVTHIVYQIYLVLRDRPMTNSEPEELPVDEKTEKLLQQLLCSELTRTLTLDAEDSSKRQKGELYGVNDSWSLNENQTNDNICQEAGSYHIDSECEVFLLPHLQTNISICSSEGEIKMDTKPDDRFNEAVIKKIRIKNVQMKIDKFAFEKRKKRHYIKQFAEEKQQHKRNEKKNLALATLFTNQLRLHEASKLVKTNEKCGYADSKNCCNDSYFEKRNSSRKYTETDSSSIEAENLKKEEIVDVNKWKTKWISFVDDHRFVLETNTKEMEQEHMTLGQYVTKFCFDLSIIIVAFRERTGCRFIPSVLFRKYLDLFIIEKDLNVFSFDQKLLKKHYSNELESEKHNCFHEYMIQCEKWDALKSEMNIQFGIENHTVAQSSAITSPIRNLLQCENIFTRQCRSVLENVNLISIVGKSYSGKSECLKSLRTSNSNLFVLDIEQLLLEAVGTFEDFMYIKSNLKHFETFYSIDRRVPEKPNNRLSIGGNGYFHSCLLSQSNYHLTKCNTFEEIGNLSEQTTSSNTLIEEVFSECHIEQNSEEINSENKLLRLGEIVNQSIEKNGYVDDYVLSLLLLEWIESLPQNSTCVVEGFPSTIEQAKALYLLSYIEKGNRQNFINIRDFDEVLLDHLAQSVFGNNLDFLLDNQLPRTQHNSHRSNFSTSFLQSKSLLQSQWPLVCLKAANLHLIVEINIGNDMVNQRMNSRNVKMVEVLLFHEKLGESVKMYEESVTQLQENFPVKSNIQYIQGTQNVNQLNEQFNHILRDFKHRKLLFLLEEQALQLRREIAYFSGFNSLQNSFTDTLDGEDPRGSSEKRLHRIPFKSSLIVEKSYLTASEQNDRLQSSSLVENCIPSPPKPPFSSDPQYHLIRFNVPENLSKIVGVAWAMTEAKYSYIVKENLYNLLISMRQSMSYLDEVNRKFNTIRANDDDMNKMAEIKILEVKKQFGGGVDNHKEILTGEDLEKNLVELADFERKRGEDFLYDLMKSGWVNKRLQEMCCSWAAILQSEERLNTMFNAIVDAYYMNAFLRLLFDQTETITSFQRQQATTDITSCLIELEFNNENIGELQTTNFRSTSLASTNLEHSKDSEKQEKRNVFCLTLSNKVRKIIKAEPELAIDYMITFLHKAFEKDQILRKKTVLMCFGHVKKGLKENVTTNSIYNPPQYPGEIFHQVTDSIRMSTLTRLLAEYMTLISQIKTKYYFRLSTIRTRALSEMKSLHARNINTISNIQDKIDYWHCTDLNRANQLKHHIHGATPKFAEVPQFQPKVFSHEYGTQEFSLSQTSIKHDFEPVKCDFNFEQIRSLWKHFSRVSPDGVISRKAFSFILQDLSMNASPKNDLPRFWLNLDQIEVEHFSRILSSETEVINWRRFLFDNLADSLPAPSSEDLSSVETILLSTGYTDNGRVSAEDAAQCLHWLSNRIRVESAHSASDLKALLVELTGSPGQTTFCPFTLLLYVCRSPDIATTFARALGIVRMKARLKMRLSQTEVNQCKDTPNEKRIDKETFTDAQPDISQKSLEQSFEAETKTNLLSDSIAVEDESSEKTSTNEMAEVSEDISFTPEDTRSIASDNSTSKNIQMIVTTEERQLSGPDPDENESGWPGVALYCCAHPPEPPAETVQQILNCKEEELVNLTDLRDLLRETFIISKSQKSETFRDIDRDLATVYNDVFHHKMERTVFALEHQAFLPISISALFSHKLIKTYLEGNCLLKIINLRSQLLDHGKDK